MLLLGLSPHVGPPELLQPFFRGLAGRLSLQRPGPRRHQTTATASVPGPGLSLVRPAAPRNQSEAGMTARDVAALPDTLPGTWCTPAGWWSSAAWNHYSHFPRCCPGHFKMTSSSLNNAANLSPTLNLLLCSLNSTLRRAFMTPHLSSNFQLILIDRKNF